MIASHLLENYHSKYVDFKGKQESEWELAIEKTQKLKDIGELVTARDDFQTVWVFFKIRELKWSISFHGKGHIV